MYQFNIQQYNNKTIEQSKDLAIQQFKPPKNSAIGPKKLPLGGLSLAQLSPLLFLVIMAEIYTFGVINYTFLLQYTF